MNGGNRDSFMRSSDAFSWYQESDPALRATIVAVLWLDRAPAWEVLRDRVALAAQRVDRLRQVVHDTPLPLTPPRWLPDPHFDLSWHLRRVAAPGDRSPASVLALARAEAMTAFDHSRPLWTITVVEHLAGGKAAVIVKVHHSLTDGIGAMRLAPELFDTRREPARPAPRRAEPARDPVPLPVAALSFHVGRVVDTLTGAVRSAIPSGLGLLTDPLGSARTVVRTVRSIGRTVAPVRESMSEVMRGRGLGRDLMLLTVDLNDLAAVAKAHGATVNDAFLTAVTGGLRGYHQHHRSRAARLRVTMPVSIRTADDSPASNRITLLRLALPVSEPDVVARMSQIHRACRRVRSAPSLGFTDAIAGMLDVLPTAVTGAMLKRVDFLASDVTGLPKPVFLAGAKVIEYAAFGPTMGCAANLTLLSYAGVCHVGITTDSAAVADPAVFLRCLRDGFAEVLSLRDRHNGVRLRADDEGRAVEDLGPASGSLGGTDTGAAMNRRPEANDGNHARRRAPDSAQRPHPAQRPRRGPR